jgi:hypothetical protein
MCQTERSIVPAISDSCHSLRCELGRPSRAQIPISIAASPQAICDQFNYTDGRKFATTAIRLSVDSVCRIHGSESGAPLRTSDFRYATFRKLRVDRDSDHRKDKVISKHYPIWLKRRGAALTLKKGDR